MDPRLTQLPFRAGLWFNARMKSIFLLACSALVLLAGCASPAQKDGRLPHAQFDVANSALDWLEVAYYPRPDDPRIPFPCRLSFFGTGEIQFKTGRSPQIASAFSEEVNHPYWNEVFSDRLHLDAAEIQEVFQIFVDEGVVPRRAFVVSSQKVHAPYVNIAGTIGMQKIRRATDNVFLVGLVEEAMDNFEPVLARAREARRAEDGGGEAAK